MAQASMALLLMASDTMGMDAGADGNARHPACETADECAELARGYRTGEGASKDPRVASVLYQTACDKGNALSCSDLAYMLAVGVEIRRNEKRSVDLFIRSCTLGFGNACFSAGNIFLQGSQEPGIIWKDNVRAAELFRKGCDENEGVACHVLAGLYDRGQGVAKDKALARQLRKRAAQLGFELE